MEMTIHILSLSRGISQQLSLLFLIQYRDILINPVKCYIFTDVDNNNKDNILGYPNFRENFQAI